MGGKRKWTKEACKKDARRFSTRTEWERGSRGSYQSARKKGWVEECTAHMPKHARIKWNFKACVKDARRFGTRTEWQRGSPGSYTAAWRNGWLEDCAAHMKTGGELSLDLPEEIRFDPCGKPIFVQNDNVRIYFGSVNEAYGFGFYIDGALNESKKYKGFTVTYAPKGRFKRLVYKRRAKVDNLLTELTKGGDFDGTEMDD